MEHSSLCSKQDLASPSSVHQFASTASVFSVPWLTFMLLSTSGSVSNIPSVALSVSWSVCRSSVHVTFLQRHFFILSSPHFPNLCWSVPFFEFLWLHTWSLQVVPVSTYHGQPFLLWLRPIPFKFHFRRYHFSFLGLTFFFVGSFPLLVVRLGKLLGGFFTGRQER